MLTETVTTKNEPAFFSTNSEPMPEFVDMPFEDIEELPIDHPGAHDDEYRTRRDYIASLSKKFREDPEHKLLTLIIRPKSRESGKSWRQNWKNCTRNMLRHFILEPRKSWALRMNTFRSFRK